VGFYILLTPLIKLWLGDKWILPGAVIAAILIDYYFKGERVVLSNYKTAAGVFEQDKYLPLVQGAVNLVISVMLVIKIGLIGVYIGTIVSGLLANIIRPVIIYRVCFERKATSYFYDTVRYAAVIMLRAVQQYIYERGNDCLFCRNDSYYYSGFQWDFLDFFWRNRGVQVLICNFQR
jgi:O-antigen/teichoic acid export membrane protein